MLKNFGLSTLMEAINMSKRSEESSEGLTAMFEEAIDDDIIAAVTGNDNDTVEEDMDGAGAEDDDEMEALLAKIPPSDEMTEEEMGAMTESDMDALTECLLPEGIAV